MQQIGNQFSKQLTAENLITNDQEENFQQALSSSDQSQSDDIVIFIWIVAVCVLVVLAFACICMMCKRKRQKRLNANFTVHSHNRYIKVDGRIVGKNVGPNPVIFHAPNTPHAPKSNNRQVQNNPGNPYRQVQKPVHQKTAQSRRIMDQRPNQVTFQHPQARNPLPHGQNRQQTQHLRPPMLKKQISQSSQNEINPYGFS